MVTRFNLLRNLLITLVIGLSIASSVLADSREEMRLTVGLKLFPATLGAVEELEQRLVEQQLRVGVVYDKQHRRAQETVETLNAIGEIKSFPIRAEAIKLADLTHKSEQQWSALFVVEALNGHLKHVVNYSVDHSIIAYSTIEGDVERGVSTGFLVQDRVLPYANIGILNRSKVTLREFFLRVTVRYEE